MMRFTAILVRLILVSFCLAAGPVSANDAFIDQVSLADTTVQVVDPEAENGEAVIVTTCPDDVLCQQGNNPTTADLPPLRGNGNTALVRQFGTSNLSVVQMLGERNRTMLLQDGQVNRSDISLLGTDNSAVTTQIGDRNESQTLLQGSRNVVEHAQFGNDLAARVEHIGSNLDLRIVQTRQ